jgi:hypothetical protein
MLSLPKTLTGIAVSRAVYGTTPQRTSAIKFLRTVGSKDQLLRLCYSSDRPFTDLPGFMIKNILKTPSAKKVQNIYYLVTGTPYNAVEPPGLRSMNGSRMIDMSDWDFEQGGDSVAAKLRGLTLSESRIDGRINAASGTAYTEWIMVFKNTSSAQREARATVALPADSVVSRVTLWIDGEEREAAYAGRAEVKAAYKKVVRRRRDPVLVTTYAPNRIMMQCFPVPPNGGTMKIKIGITSPLILESPDSGLLSLPRFVERNFSIDDELQHTVWYESQQTLLQTKTTGSELVQFAPQSKHGLKGSISDAELSKTISIKVKRNPAPMKLWTEAARGPEGFNIIQEIKSVTNCPPQSLAIVIDGSFRMEPFAESITETVTKLQQMTKCEIFIASDEVEHITSKSSDAVSQIDFKGGCDNTPALEAAWDCALTNNGAILWLHATQPIEIQKTEALLQRFERSPNAPILYDYQLGSGQNLIAKKLEKQPAFKRIPQLLRPTADLTFLTDRWSGKVATFRYERKALAAINDISAYTHSTDLHIARLWAKERVTQLTTHSRQKGDHAKAVKLATDYMLVTPVSGAVVLETQKQYADAGLTPADSFNSPAVVPEPATWALMLTGILIMAIFSARKHQRIKSGTNA